jgi:hypothetical protein
MQNGRLTCLGRMRNEEVMKQLELRQQFIKRDDGYFF